MTIKANIEINQGTDFDAEIELLDQDANAINLTGYSAWGQMKKNYASSDATSFTVEFIVPRTDGKLKIKLSETQTNTLTPGRYLYDVVVEDGNGKYTRAVQGTATVTPGVTSSHLAS